MRTRLFPKASRLGFGCASLGSRVGRRRGLKALAAAFEHGVNWFDLAPSYGDGEAEAIFAHFSKGRRADIHICTKCGIEPVRSGSHSLRRVARPIARTIVTIAPRLRGFVAKSRRSAYAVPLSATLIRESLDRSLARLGTSYVDVYALHDPSPIDVVREDVHRQLEAILTSGKARAIGIAGSIDAVAEARRAGLPIGVVQIADPPFERALANLHMAIGPDWPFMLSTHSIFGRMDLTMLLTKRLGSEQRLRAILAASGYTMPFDEAVRALLLDCAMVRNREGVVILSMFSREHLLQNVARTKVDNMNPAMEQFRSLDGGCHD